MKALALTVLIAVLAGCGSLTAPPPSGSPTQQSPTPSSSPSANPAPAALKLVHDPGHVTGTVTGPCFFRDSGKLPDPGCTPGAADPAVTQANIAATICRAGYTATVRPPSSAATRAKYEQEYPAYGVGSGTPAELDHLVPLELGGSNDLANLWPEVGAVPNAKDQVERALNRAVCSGQVTLAAAQDAIAADWEDAEAQLRLGG